MKIAIVTSTRADWGLLSPLAHRLQKMQGIDLSIIAANMHLLPQYGHTVDEIIADGFEIAARVPMHCADDSAAARVMAMGECMQGAAEAFEAINPDIVVILGDRYEMLAIASAAEVMRIPIAHIAGGEISEGAIDDSIRHAITKLSALHFTATEPYRQRVIQMGESPERVINAGALGVWNAMHQPLMGISQLQESLDFEFDEKKLVLATLHPATLDDINNGQVMRNMIDALDHFHDYKVILTYPNNDAGSQQILDVIATINSPRYKIVKSLGMRRYLSTLLYAKAVVGNSSSGIVEVPSTGIPTVDIGMRQHGRIAAPSVIHCGNDADDIRQAIAQALSPDMQNLARQRENPYYKDNTVDIIANTLAKAKPDTLCSKKFYDL